MTEWIEIDLADHGAGNDKRRESRRPDLESIRILGEPLSTEGNWRARRDIVDALPHRTKMELEAFYESDRVSLGIVRPTEVLDLKVEPVEREWKPQWQGVLNQFNLFSGPPKHLEKLPYKFSYNAGLLMPRIVSFSILLTITLAGAWWWHAYGNHLRL